MRLFLFPLFVTMLVVVEATKNPYDLNDLPNELLRSIADKFDNRTDLLNYRLTCQNTRSATSLNNLHKGIVSELEKEMEKCSTDLESQRELVQAFEAIQSCQSDKDPFAVLENVARGISELEAVLLGSTFFNGDILDGYIFPSAGKALLDKAQVVIRNTKSFFSNNKERSRFIHSDEGITFLAKSVMSSIFGNVPICLRVNRLATLAKTLAPVFATTATAEGWKRVQRTSNMDQYRAYLQSEQAPNNIRPPTINIDGKDYGLPLHIRDHLVLMRQQSNLEQSNLRPRFVSFEKVIENLRKDMEELINDPRLPKSDRVRALKVFGYSATAPFLISVLVHGIFRLVLRYNLMPILWLFPAMKSLYLWYSAITFPVSSYLIARRAFSNAKMHKQDVLPEEKEAYQDAISRKVRSRNRYLTSE